MLYRALHIMSTQRYRLPVRRYIVELFHQEMNQELVNALSNVAKRLKASPSYKPPRTDTIRMSVFGRVGKSRRPSESDESEDDGMGTPAMAPNAAVEQPIINLQPLKKIVGFSVSAAWLFFFFQRTLSLYPFTHWTYGLLTVALHLYALLYITMYF